MNQLSATREKKIESLAKLSGKKTPIELISDILSKANKIKNNGASITTEDVIDVKAIRTDD